MRPLPALVALALALALASCGGGAASDSTSAVSQVKEGHPDASVGANGAEAKPKLHYPAKPPRHVVVRLLKEGSGPPVKPGEELAARYIAGNPKTKFVKDFWSKENPYKFQFGHNYLAKAWGIGLKGMRIGGRRELIIPSRLAYHEGMMVFVIELLAIEKPKSGR